MKKILIRVLALGIAAAAVVAGYRFVQGFQQKQQLTPTTTVRQGDVVIRSYTRGELRSVRSAMLVAPNLFGTVQITRLASLGSFAREKDLVVEFDDSEVQSRLDEKDLELQSLDEQLKKAQAELEISNNQDQVELLRTRYSVRRAELEVKRNELLSAIDARKNLLNLDEAQRKLKQLESDVKSRLESSQAQLAVLREKKNKALLELNRERQRLNQVKLLAPMSGLVAIRQNRTTFLVRGMQLPDLREGDQVFPGLPVADVLDLSELEVAAKVGELDRANLHENQDVTMRLDAAPDRVFHGRIKNLSGTASANVYSGDMAKKFDVTISVDMKQLLAGLGAKPEQIKTILDTADRNRSKPAAAQSSPLARMALLGAPGGPAYVPGGQPAPGAAAEGPPEPAPSRGEGGGRMRFGANLSPENQQKVREAMQKFLNGRSPQDLSDEDRTKMREQMRALTQSLGGGAEAGGRRGAGAQNGAEGGGRRGGAQNAEAGGRGFAFGAPRAAPGAGETPGGMGFGGFGMGGSQQFSAKDLAEAKLPPPPSESSQLDVLLRPGLLADVEIIVEKIPNAIHIPVQAVFEKDGKPVVYVKNAGQFETRLIKPLKRSESTMVVAEGLRAGEQVALADPFAKTAGKKQEKPAGAGPAMPSGSGGGRP